MSYIEYKSIIKNIVVGSKSLDGGLFSPTMKKGLDDYIAYGIIKMPITLKGGKK